MKLLSYLLSLSIVTTVIIYILNVPGYITGADKLVKEYYYDNAIKSFVLDIFLIAIYILAGEFVSNLINVTSNSGKLLVIAGTSMLISSAFMLLFLYLGKTKSFFSRWFHRVGFDAVVYDVILVTSVYLVYKIITPSHM